VETGIGATLREARTRRKVDLSEVEAATKIRIRYLQAIENEDWDVLPGGAYTRGFIRTYAGYLGLDGERLAEEYRRGTAPAGGERAPRRVEPVASGTPAAGRSRIPSRFLAVVVSLALVGLVIAIGLTGGDDDGNGSPSAPNAQPDSKRNAVKSERRAVAVQPGVAVRLEATAEVWVCLLDSDEEPVVNGEILQAGAEAGPFRADGFTASFGNGEFELTIDGKPAETPSSSSPIGYEIDSGGDLTPLEEGERPDCT
jgi:transcriptional regulator with XRE-family HTH domain